MIAGLVYTSTGHFRIPGPSATLGVNAAFSLPPPSTFRGFLQSMIGRYDELDGQFAYGITKHGSLSSSILQKTIAYSSSMKNGGSRPVIKPIMYGQYYKFLFEGPDEERFKAFLEGRAKRSGALYLGESYNLCRVVSSDTNLEEVDWVCPDEDGSLRLITKAFRGWDTSHLAEYGTFSLRSVDSSNNIPWMK